jgi:hypothetical protein
MFGNMIPLKFLPLINRYLPAREKINNRLVSKRFNFWTLHAENNAYTRSIIKNYEVDPFDEKKDVDKIKYSYILLLLKQQLETEDNLKKGARYGKDIKYTTCRNRHPCIISRIELIFRVKESLNNNVCLFGPGIGKKEKYSFQFREILNCLRKIKNSQNKNINLTVAEINQEVIKGIISDELYMQNKDLLNIKIEKGDAVELLLGLADSDLLNANNIVIGTHVFHYSFRSYGDDFNLVNKKREQILDKLAEHKITSILAEGDLECFLSEWTFNNMKEKRQTERPIELDGKYNLLIRLLTEGHKQCENVWEMEMSRKRGCTVQ